MKIMKLCKRKIYEKNCDPSWTAVLLYLTKFGFQSSSSLPIYLSLATI